MDFTEIQTDIAKDTLEGLSSPQKYLSSKYFYDDKGSKIFQDIMKMPEYYLTDCELEIFQSNKQEILKEFAGQEQQFEILELGAGDGLKTKVLLSHFLKTNTDFNYIPIDISEDAVKNMVAEFEKEMPDLHINGQIGDYFDLIGDFKLKSQKKKIILFLGSNIGNFSGPLALDFLTSLRNVLNPNDQVFIGFDLKKDPDTIMNAYNDPHGHTAAFNLNLLERLNNEIGANFHLDNFKHHEVYNPQSGAAKSYLISQKDQEVYIAELDKTFSFKKWESIFMERSQKYDMNLINGLALNSGFEIVRNFYDERQFFVNSLWKLKK